MILSFWSLASGVFFYYTCVEYMVFCFNVGAFHTVLCGCSAFCVYFNKHSLELKVPCTDLVLFLSKAIEL
jgi:hypothetical protein